MKSNIVVLFMFVVTINVGAQTFSDAVEHYFMTGDLTQAQLFIGRTVSDDDMRKFEKDYPGGGLYLSKSRPRLGVSFSIMNSRTILLSLTFKLVNGKNNYEIWDVKGIELRPGYTAYVDHLMTQSRDFPNGNVELEDAIGLLMIKEGERVPVEQRLIPHWIITADKDGKLILTEPKDKSKYLFMPGGPI